MNDEDLYEHLIGLRQQLRSMLSQVTFAIDSIKAQSQAFQADPASMMDDGEQEPRTFGSNKEILNAGR